MDLDLSKKTVTVILPTFNHENFVKKSIDSILSQTYDDFFLILYDDNSTDGTWDIINQYNDKRIRG